MHVAEDWNGDTVNQRSKSLKRNSKVHVRLVLSRLRFWFGVFISLNICSL